MLEPRTEAEWNMTVLRWAFYLSVLWALTAALVVAKSSGWIL